MNRQVHGRKKTARRVLRTSGLPPQLNCMAIPTEGETLLLPTSVMEEVVDFEQPAAIEFAPPWLLGNIEWDNRQVPVFSFTALINGADVGTIPPRSKIVILKSLAKLRPRTLPGYCAGRPATSAHRQIGRPGRNR